MCHFIKIFRNCEILNILKESSKDHSHRKNSKTVEFTLKAKVPTISENSGDKETTSKGKNRKYSQSFDDTLPKLKKQVKSYCNYNDENMNYLIISEDVLETVEVLKVRKMSI